MECKDAGLQGRRNRKEKEAGSYLSEKVIASEVVAGIVMIIMLNILVICVYRWYHKQKRQQIVKEVVNQEVSKYFKIATSE